MVRQTSIEGYNSIRGKIGQRQEEVLKTILKFGPMNNRAISEVLQRPINTVTPRVNELRKAGLVQEESRRKDPRTKVRTIWWEAI